MSYQRTSTPRTYAGLQQENRLLRAKIATMTQAHEAQLAGARRAAKTRRPDEYPATTPEALAQALQRVQATFPDSDATKNARLLTLDRELRQFQHHGTDKASA